MRRIIGTRAVVLLALVVLVGPVGAEAAEGGAPERVDITGTATGMSVQLGGTAGTVCDPGRWGEPGASECTLHVRGSFTGTMRIDLGTETSVRGHYWGAITVTPWAHAPDCRESGGTLTYSVFLVHGPKLGTVTAPLDAGDSQVCQGSGSTDREYFFRGDPSDGTGAFEEMFGGNTLFIGSGTRVGNSGVYRDNLSFDGRTEFPVG